MSRAAQLHETQGVPEQVRLDEDLRGRISDHHERVNSRLRDQRSGIRKVSRAELIRTLLRAALDAEESGR